MKRNESMNGNLLKHVTLFAVFTVTAQPPVLDEWVRINQGFGKCPDIGQSGPEYEWYRDHLDRSNTQLIWKRGIMYAVSIR